LTTSAPGKGEAASNVKRTVSASIRPFEPELAALPNEAKIIAAVKQALE